VSTMQSLLTLWFDDSGVTTVEYAFVLAALSLAGVVAFSSVNYEIRGVVDKCSQKMESISGIGCGDYR